MIINFLSIDLIAFELFIVIVLLAYIAWLIIPRKGGKNERNYK